MHLRHRSHSDMRGLPGLTMSPSSFSRACARLSHLGNGVVLLLAALSLFPLTVHAAEQLGTLRFATPGPTITTLPMQIASEKGMDKEEGFTAAFTNTTGSVAIKAMLAGDFDVTLSVGGSLTAGVSGAPTKVIYVHVAKPLYFLYGREGVANVKALEGLRVGVDATGGSGEFALRRAMQAGGADPSKATFLAMGFQNTPPSLIAGAVDAAVLTPPTEFQLAKSGKTFVNLGFLGDYAAGLTGGVGTTDKMIRERPNALRAVLRAQAKAHRFVLENLRRDDRGHEPLSQHVRGRCRQVLRQHRASPLQQDWGHSGRRAAGGRRRAGQNAEALEDPAALDPVRLLVHRELAVYVRLRLDRGVGSRSRRRPHRLP